MAASAAVLNRYPHSRPLPVPAGFDLPNMFVILNINNMIANLSGWDSVKYSRQSSIIEEVGGFVRVVGAGRRLNLGLHDDDPSIANAVAAFLNWLGCTPAPHWLGL